MLFAFASNQQPTTGNRFSCISPPISLLFLPLIASAQPPHLKWMNYYVEGYNSGARSVQQTAEGGFILTGVTVPYGSSNGPLYLVKTDIYGDTLWTRTFGEGLANNGYEVKQTDDEGYIVVGTTVPAGEVWSDIYLVRTDENGDSLWTRNYGGDESDFGVSVDQTLDSGFIITGNVNPDYSTCYIYLMKTDVNGDTVWTKTFTDSWGQGRSVLQLPDGNYIVAGARGVMFTKVFLMKVDENGNTIWLRTYGGYYNDGAHCVKRTRDGGFIIVGYTRSYGAGDCDVYLIKTDAEGDTLWTQTYGGEDYDVGFCVDQTLEGGYIIAGHTESYGAGNDDVYLIRTDSLGDTLWTCTYGFESADFGYSVIQTTEGEFVAAANIQFDPPAYYATLICLENAGVLVEEKEVRQPNEFALYQNYPNPFNSQTAIPFTLDRAGMVTIDIFDITGRSVGAKGLSPLQARYSAGMHEIIWNTEGVGSGVYLVRLQQQSAGSAIGTNLLHGSLTAVRKVVLMK